MNDEKEIRDWFQDQDELLVDEQSVQRALEKTRSATAQKDVMDLVFVKIWAAMLVLLAPLFASAARRQSEFATKTPSKQNNNDLKFSREDKAIKNINGDSSTC